MFKRKKNNIPVEVISHDVLNPDVETVNESNLNALKDAKKASKALKDILEENHIHIRIYQAAGGKLKKREV